MDRLKDLVRQAKSIAYSDIENKVREATSNEPWGPSSTLLSELAQATNFQNEVYTEMVTMLWKRLLHEGQPRHTLKVRNDKTRSTESSRAMSCSPLLLRGMNSPCLISQ